MFKKMFNKAKELYKKVQYTLNSIAITAMTTSMMMPVFADDTGKTIEVEDNIDVTQIVGKIAGTVLQILQGVGLIFIVWGGFQFAMSLRDEDAASKHRAILVLIAGCAMCGLETLLHMFGLIKK